MIWNCGPYKFDTRMPIVMGILNVTPDSFSDGGSYAGEDEAVRAGLQMVEDGAYIVDVGGESTRPGSDEVAAEEELDRALGVVRRLAAEGVCVSVDTRHATVAQACVDAGASIINDVSGFRDPAMVAVAAGCDAGLVVMHMKGEPKTMQKNPHYDDVVREVCDYLRVQASMLEDAGVDHSRICVDPGPGFGKTPQQTMELMHNIHEIRHLGYPVMAAVSRKRFIGWAYSIENAADRDEASAQEALYACELGASIVRAHNVPATVKALESLRPYALIALGCNVPLIATSPGEETAAKIAQIDKAIGDLSLLPDTQLIDVSSYYESEPAYYEDQDTFVNAVALLRTGIAPHELLGYLHAVENSLGRVRSVPNGPRTCDLDILDYQLYLSDDDVLTLPHPRIAERDFVVKPLLEILPGHVLADGTPVTVDAVRVGSAQKVSA